MSNTNMCNDCSCECPCDCACGCCGMEEIKVGKVMPDFELEGYEKDQIKKYKLSDLRGKWSILFFYPADFTFVCPTELEEMADYYDKFKSLNTEVWSVSTDTVFVHKAWHDSSEAIKKVNFPMLADPTHSLSSMLGVLIEEEGVTLRATCIIDPKGVLKSIEINDNSIGRSARELYRKLQAAQYVESHNGQVCPASWEPGDDTLTPGLDLVGKI